MRKLFFIAKFWSKVLIMFFFQVSCCKWIIIGERQNICESEWSILIKFCWEVHESNVTKMQRYKSSALKILKIYYSDYYSYYSDLLPPNADVNPNEWHKSTRHISLPLSVEDTSAVSLIKPSHSTMSSFRRVSLQASLLSEMRTRTFISVTLRSKYSKIIRNSLRKFLIIYNTLCH